MRHLNFIFVTASLLLSSVVLTAQVNNQESMREAIERLEQARKDNNPRAEATALCDVATIDLMSSLDAEAENYASQAEKIARDRRFHDLLSRSLVIKSNLCAYAETDSTYNRNDEGLVYAEEALKEAELSGSEQLILEACFSISQLYVNKNRWNKVLNAEWYARAGEALDRAEELAKSAPPANKAKSLALRMRYIRQGKDLDKAIRYCEDALEKCDEQDNLMRAQLYDQLTPIYIETGRYAEAAQSHSAYVHYFTLYSRASEAEKLQEMQGKYEMELKQSQLEKKTYQILFLTIAAAFLAVLATLFIIRSRREKKLRIEAQQENIAKQELIEFISQDLKNPCNAGRHEFEEFARNVSRMSEEQIEEETKKLLEEGRHLSREVAEYVSDIIISRKKTVSAFGLTSREMEIVRLSMEGLTANEIAEKLYLSPRTVNNHKSSVYSKMGVKTNGEMCRKAREAGIN